MQLPPRADARSRRRQRRREDDTWLIAITFVAIVLAGFMVFALAEGGAPTPEMWLLWSCAIALCVLSPPPVLRLVWHKFANLAAFEKPHRLLSPRTIDGDTIEDVRTGVRYRLANIDAPETGDNAKCHRERERGESASRAATDFIRAAKRVEVRRTFRTDMYGRRVAFVLVDGQDLGTLLVRRGLARPWRGQRAKWCGPHGGLAKIARAGWMAHSCMTCRHWKRD